MKRLVVEDLKYRYPLSQELALNDISFAVEKGEFIGIVGPNGAGKSTLCQAITGLAPNFLKGAYGGRVLVDGMEVAKEEIAEIATHVGIVFQNPFTQIAGSKLTVFEEVAFGLENLGIPRYEMKKRIEEALELLDIAALRDRNPFDLSGGQMQRLAIAGIIAMKPEIIVLDEPTSQLDPQGSEEVFQAVQNLSREGMTVLMVEHKIEKIAAYADKVLLLCAGKLIDFERPPKVFSREDLEDYGIAPPVFTRVCKKLNIKTADGLYPVTLKEAYDKVVKILE
ncbi:MAG TPA: cobalt ABC transporter ATP-binding protein [Firmicutes bacterium]|jgi:energy-coupling factor transport system ATP-binding protein|nr:cobalt ABC transporter ATP-binding protein [Bacillota bacterium]HBK67491.1 cobalt ABC transporter ATP-binding protein [Bacillota bacterium]